jgi:hypothetical protein
MEKLKFCLLRLFAFLILFLVTEKILAARVYKTVANSCVTARLKACKDRSQPQGGSSLNDTSFFAPAFYGAWLIKRYNTQQNLQAVRAVIDGVIIISSAVTMGTTAAPLIAGAEALLGTIDLVITLNQNALNNSIYGQQINAAWDEFMISLAAAGLGNLAVKITANGLEKITIKIAQNGGLVSSVQLLSSTTKQQIISKFNNLRNHLELFLASIGKISVSNILKSVLAFKLSEIDLLAKCSSTIVKVKQQIVVYALVANTEYNIATLAFQGNKNYLQLNSGILIEANSLTGKNVICKIENAYYSKPNSYNLKQGDLHVVNEGGVIKVCVLSNMEKAFNHLPTSGAIITKGAKQGTFLIGSFESDLKYIFPELNYPEIATVNFSFPVPQGQKFNLLNIAMPEYNYWVNNGGFFTKVNGPWIDAAVIQNADIIVVSDVYKLENIYKKITINNTISYELTGFGKEVHRLEWKHGFRFDPVTKTMVNPSKASGLTTITKQADYIHQ